MGITIIVSNYPVVIEDEPLLDAKEISRFNQYRAGQSDRLANLNCKSSNGDYPDGWYNPVKLIPPFLSREQYNKYLDSRT